MDSNSPEVVWEARIEYQALADSSISSSFGQIADLHHSEVRNGFDDGQLRLLEFEPWLRIPLSNLTHGADDALLRNVGDGVERPKV